MSQGAPRTAPLPVHALRGSTNHASGKSAEEQVIRHYQRHGADLLHHRWRGKAGEVDLIFQCGREILFVEVKSSKTHARAAALLSKRQIARLCQACEEFLGTCPQGGLTPMRLDLATVDASGRIEVLENALMAA